MRTGKLAGKERRMDGWKGCKNKRRRLRVQGIKEVEYRKRKEKEKYDWLRIGEREGKQRGGKGRGEKNKN